MSVQFGSRSSKNRRQLELFSTSSLGDEHRWNRDPPSYVVDEDEMYGVDSGKCKAVWDMFLEE